MKLFIYSYDKYTKYEFIYLCAEPGVDDILRDCSQIIIVNLYLIQCEH